MAHHSGALIKVEGRGLAHELSLEFAPVRDDLADPLIYCDTTVGPNGNSVSVEERFAEGQARYGTYHLVSQPIRRASPRLINAVRRVYAKGSTSTFGWPHY